MTALSTHNPALDFTSPPKPIVGLNIAGIPSELKDYSQWVCWKYEWNGREWTKIPIDGRTGKKASSTNPKTWSSLREVSDAFDRDSTLAGIGFVFSADDPFCGIDLDECLNAEGLLVPEAQPVLKDVASYCERSPGGRGLKIIGKARKPSGVGCKKRKVYGCKAVEVYDAERYFTITGTRWSAAPTTIDDCQIGVEHLCNSLWPPKPSLRLVGSAASGIENDDELIERAGTARNGEQFKRLFAGDTSMHGDDDSSADLALCSHLAFWTAKNPEQMDRIFRR